MPNYVCSNGACSTAGATFALTSAGQTFCPRCNTPGALAPAPVVVAAPVTQTRVVQGSNAMHKVSGKDAGIVEELIAKWEVNLVSDDEAKTVKDYVYTFDKNANRIDREGPVRSGNQVVTHARFRLQVGKSTYAGIHMKIDEVLDAATIRRAFRESVNARKYVEVYLA